MMIPTKARAATAARASRIAKATSTEYSPPPSVILPTDVGPEQAPGQADDQAADRTEIRAGQADRPAVAPASTLEPAENTVVEADSPRSLQADVQAPQAAGRAASPWSPALASRRLKQLLAHLECDEEVLAAVAQLPSLWVARVVDGVAPQSDVDDVVPVVIARLALDPLAFLAGEGEAPRTGLQLLRDPARTRSAVANARREVHRARARRAELLALAGDGTAPSQGDDATATLDELLCLFAGGDDATQFAERTLETISDQLCVLASARDGGEAPNDAVMRSFLYDIEQRARGAAEIGRRLKIARGTR